MTTVLINHLTIEDKGVARVSGSRSKVSQIVCDVRNGLSPEVDVVTAQEDGSDGLEDPLLLDRAPELGRVLFSQDEDFFAITAERQTTGEHFAGVIYAHPAEVSIGKCIEDLELMAKVYNRSDMFDRLEFPPIR